MLQAIPSKTDARTAAAAPKEKEKAGASEDPGQGLSSLFAQYLAAMPAAQTPAAPTFTNLAPVKSRTEPPAKEEPSSSRLQTERQGSRDVQETRDARVQAASGDRSGSTPSGTPDRTAQDPKDGADSEASQASRTPQAPGQPESAGQTLPGKGKSSPKATGEEASNPAAGTEAPAASAAKAPSESMRPAQAQEALQRLVPEAGLQNASGEASAPQGVRKPALSELLNQPKVDIQSPSFMEAPASAGDALPLDEAQGTLQSPLPEAQAAALLALGQMPKDPSGTAPASNAAAALPVDAVGAAAAPGASGAVRVSAPPSTQASTPVKRDTPMAQVDSSIRWLIKNKEQSAELQLHPESLGKVQIKLTVEGSEVHAKLWASDAAAMPVLQEHRAQLEASLKDQGLSLGSFDLQQGRRSDQGPQPQPDPSPLLAAGPQEVALDGQDSPSAAAPSPAGPYRIEIVA